MTSTRVLTCPVDSAPAFEDGPPVVRDREGRDRTGQRAAAQSMIERLSRLERGAPDHEELRCQVIAEYMPFARHLASRYSSGNQPAEDLRQVAYVGLVKAVDRFDPGFGTPFPGYAMPVILGELKRHFRDASWPVHVPRRIQELYGDVRPAAEVLVHRLGREPTAAELAVLLGSRPRDVAEAIDAGGLRTVASLDLPVGTGEGQGSALGDLLGAEDREIQKIVDRETLRPLLAQLSAREKEILLMTYFQEMTQTQIGAALGVSQMHVSRLLAAILARLRHRVRAEQDL
ncbi:MAG TPA: SigB/SigF/SigG family RNA polymerase sigma factor [Actinocrinis sp.]|nr:SigB/SigF/SigG family RNA polymerase sigma factor [Actinocrinis sp.]